MAFYAEGHKLSKGQKDQISNPTGAVLTKAGGCKGKSLKRLPGLSLIIDLGCSQFRNLDLALSTFGVTWKRSKAELNTSWKLPESQCSWKRETEPQQ